MIILFRFSLRQPILKVSLTLRKPELTIWDGEWDVHLPNVKMVSGDWNKMGLQFLFLCANGSRPELNAGVGTIQSIKKLRTNQTSFVSWLHWKGPFMAVTPLWFVRGYLGEDTFSWNNNFSLFFEPQCLLGSSEQWDLSHVSGLYFQYPASIHWL